MTTNIFRAGLIGSPFYILRGAEFLYNHKVLWKYAAAPVGIGLVILGGSYWLLYYFFSGIVTSYLTDYQYGWIIFYTLLLVLSIFFLIGFFFIFTRIVSAIAAPFNDLLSQKTEELVRGVYTDTPFSFVQLLRDSSRSIAHSFKILGLYIGVMLCCLLLFVIPGIGQLLFSLIGGVLSALMYSYEFVGFSMDRKKYSWPEKKKLFSESKRPLLGFGLGCLAAAAVPIVNILFVPAAAVGATLLFIDLEKIKK